MAERLELFDDVEVVRRPLDRALSFAAWALLLAGALPFAREVDRGVFALDALDSPPALFALAAQLSASVGFFILSARVMGGAVKAVLALALVTFVMVAHACTSAFKGTFENFAPHLRVSAPLLFVLIICGGFLLAAQVRQHRRSRFVLFAWIAWPALLLVELGVAGALQPNADASAGMGLRAALLATAAIVASIAGLDRLRSRRALIAALLAISISAVTARSIAGALEASTRSHWEIEAPPDWATLLYRHRLPALSDARAAGVFKDAALSAVETAPQNSRLAARVAALVKTLQDTSRPDRVWGAVAKLNDEAKRLHLPFLLEAQFTNETFRLLTHQIERTRVFPRGEVLWVEGADHAPRRLGFKPHGEDRAVVSINAVHNHWHLDLLPGLSNPEDEVAARIRSDLEAALRTRGRSDFANEAIVQILAETVEAHELAHLVPPQLRDTAASTFLNLDEETTAEVFAYLVEISNAGVPILTALELDAVARGGAPEHEAAAARVILAHLLSAEDTLLSLDTRTLQQRARSLEKAWFVPR